MKILVAYGTTEGQTRKVARFVADRLVDAGHAVELLDANDAEGLDVGRFGAAVLAGSIHGGRYQPALVDFARGSAQALSARPGLFLSVSLSAAGDDAGEWEGIRAIADEFAQETGWRPGRVEHVAGAFRFGEYDYFKAWMMRRIAREKGETVDPEGDTEYTDWAALGAAVDDWAGALT
ncbi:protoporphyrinogen oxidase [Rhodovulum sp. 12E13]|uniref:flavodoxin domain-containing protein n=1 Tax=Rhodovulum sp. 12E13 TaxID=2203891 RepID=UPI000E12867A|nr:flavodoxin domain-containing protein [Rhodovulum sp. 12E13]RDC71174.1 protoporphyrinogen oxidase [Rhodovulum sp. 12E13]